MPTAFPIIETAHAAIVTDEGSGWLPALASFVREGLRGGAQCLCLVGKRDGALIDALTACGIDAAADEKRHALVLLAPATLQVAAAETLPERVIQALEGAFDRALAAGFTGLRIAGRPPIDDAERLRDYETRLDELCRARPCVALCGYDLAFRAPVLREALTTHPTVTVAGVTCRTNPWYELPDLGSPVRRDGRYVGQHVRWMLERLGRVAALEGALQVAEAKSRAKDEFLAALSHELRGPLGNVLGWVRVLRRTGTDRQTLERGLATIERNALAQVRLVDDILDLTRIERGELRLDLQPVDLGHVVRGVVDSVHPSADAKGVRLEVSLDGTVRPIPGDPERLQQAVTNVIGNAVKFTPPGGEIRVTVRPADGDHVALVVSDTGEGIPGNFLPHVFDHFSQREKGPARREGGVGLGLAITRQLVELHGGRVRAESEGPGRGSTFTITLPASGAKGSRAAGRRALREGAGDGRGRLERRPA
jgi:signal transduction histidine kinase